MRPLIKIDGLKQLDESVLSRAAILVDKEIFDIARDIRDRAREALRDGGNKAPALEQLARSVTITKGPAPQSYTIGTALEYGRNLEFGTQNSPESPWFGPAVAMVSRDIGKRLRRALNFLDRGKVQRTGRPDIKR